MTLTPTIDETSYHGNLMDALPVYGQPVLRGSSQPWLSDAGADAPCGLPLPAGGLAPRGRHLLADRPGGSGSRREGDVLLARLSSEQGSQADVGIVFVAAARSVSECGA